MNTRLYDILKAIALIWLPAAGTLTFAVGDIWGFAWSAQVVGTIMAVDAFLGAGLGLSTRSYNNNEKNFDGELLVNTSGPKNDLYKFNVSTDLDDMAKKKEIRLKVVSE